MTSSSQMLTVAAISAEMEAVKWGNCHENSRTTSEVAFSSITTSREKQRSGKLQLQLLESIEALPRSPILHAFQFHIAKGSHEW